MRILNGRRDINKKVAAWHCLRQASYKRGPIRQTVESGLSYLPLGRYSFFSCLRDSLR